jgi:hypothetical protein
MEQERIVRPIIVASLAGAVGGYMTAALGRLPTPDEWAFIGFFGCLFASTVALGILGILGEVSKVRRLLEEIANRDQS